MKKLSVIAFAILLVAAVSSCSLTKASRETVYNGMNVLVSYKELKIFSYNRINYYVQLGAYPKVPVAALNTAIYGMPYSKRVFSNTAFYLFKNDSALYTCNANNVQGITPAVLYLNPHKYNRQSFEAYADYFNNNWHGIVKKEDKSCISPAKDIVGVAYGAKNNFVQYFTGTYRNKPCYVEIQADGNIYCRKGVPRQKKSGIVASGILPKVQVPGHKIILADTSMFTPGKLQLFKDKEGKTLADYFAVEVSQP